MVETAITVPITAYDVAEAIAIVESSRLTHVEWLKFQEADPDWQSKVRPTDPGLPEHHRQFIESYDKVLAVLHGIKGES